MADPEILGCGWLVNHCTCSFQINNFSQKSEAPPALLNYAALLTSWSYEEQSKTTRPLSFLSFSCHIALISSTVHHLKLESECCV